MLLVKCLKPWRNLSPGQTTSLNRGVAQLLIRQGYLEAVKIKAESKTAKKPTKRSKKRAK